MMSQHRKNPARGKVIGKEVIYENRMLMRLTDGPARGWHVPRT